MLRTMTKPVNLLLLLVTLCGLMTLSGCVMHTSVWQTTTAHPAVPREQPARVVNARIPETIQLIDRLNLPHQSPWERYREWASLHPLIKEEAQIDTEEYILLGILGSAGNGFATWASLNEHVALEAAKHGGDLAIVYQRETHRVVTPGFASTSFSAGSAFTMYSPPQELSIPANGALIFRLIPGVGAARKKMLSLTEQEFQQLAAIEATYDPEVHGSMEDFWKSIGIQALDQIIAARSQRQ